jgi:hypothetical protein
LSSSSCIAAELACTPVAGGAHRTCFVDDAGEPAADGAFTIGWTILAEVPRAGTRQVRLVVVDRAGLSSPFEVVTHVR